MPWNEELKNSICSIEQLKKYIRLTPEEDRHLPLILEQHPMRVTRYYMSLINRDDPDDPIRKLAVPDVNELNLSGVYDTSGELENTKLIGLQHKYRQTALVLATNLCAMYCRHCFRKRMVGLQSQEVLKRFHEAARYISNHTEINNVLISGGDPFVLATRIIRDFLESLSGIPHLDFIRFGTRTPVTLPSRILKDDELIQLLDNYSTAERRLFVVTHFNHPNEITKQSKAAVDRLIHANVIVNNQTVLLRGVNDHPDTLATLQNRLTGIGVNPYYVFQCRPVRRVKHHFQVPLRRGYKIVEQAKTKLNGHSKRFKFCMAHRTGKIEILGIMEDEIFFKYHQAKNPENAGRFFKRQLNDWGGWLDDFEEVENNLESVLKIG